MAEPGQCQFCDRWTHELELVDEVWLLCTECAAEERRQEEIIRATPCTVCGRLPHDSDCWSAESTSDGGWRVWCPEHAAQHEAEAKARREASSHAFWEPEQGAENPLEYLFVRLTPDYVGLGTERGPVVGKGIVGLVTPTNVEGVENILGLRDDEAVAVLVQQGWERGMGWWNMGGAEGDYTIMRFHRPAH